MSREDDMNPVHLEYIKKHPFNDLAELFEVMERLDPKKRDKAIALVVMTAGIDALILTAGVVQRASEPRPEQVRRGDHWNRVVNFPVD